MFLINFEDCPDMHRRFGGNAGNKMDISYDNARWILKFDKSTKGMKRIEISYTTSALSEYVGSHVYEILGVPVHETKLGIKNNKLVVACKNFNDYDNGIELVEYREIRNAHDEELTALIDSSLTASSELGHGSNLNEIIYGLQLNPDLKRIPNASDFFWNMVVIDGLIKNSDRNTGDWGILTNYKDIYKMAPVFDNGGSFANKLSDRQMETILNDPVRFEQSNLHVTTGFYYDSELLEFRKLITLDIPELQEAIVRLTPVIQDRMTEIDDFIDGIPNEENGLRITSDIQKEFMKKGLHARFDHIIRPEYMVIQHLRNESDYVHMEKPLNKIKM